jgi:hypothetical protein
MPWPFSSIDSILLILRCCRLVLSVELGIDPRTNTVGHTVWCALLHYYVLAEQYQAVSAAADFYGQRGKCSIYCNFVRVKVGGGVGDILTTRFCLCSCTNTFVFFLYLVTFRRGGTRRWCCSTWRWTWRTGTPARQSSRSSHVTLLESLSAGIIRKYAHPPQRGAGISADAI